jgi:2-dehydro-3-deoxyphosphooctonate aldolase (KDO 8-P synthase)
LASKVIEVGYGDVKRVKIGGNNKLVLIGGPCAIENRDHALMMADRIGKICNDTMAVELIKDWKSLQKFEKSLEYLLLQIFLIRPGHKRPERFAT